MASAHRDEGEARGPAGGARGGHGNGHAHGAHGAHGGPVARGAGDGRERPMRVRKRDGREVPFAAAKIEAAVQSAMSAVGEDDASFAGEVAGVVELALRRRHGRGAEGAEGGGGAGTPGIEEIQDLVEQALIEMGRAAVAKAYILYRDQRARVREALRVHKSRPGRVSARVRVQEAGRTAPWSKGRIVAALMAEASLPRATASQVAARVETRVFDSGLKRITTGLIRELVDNELVSMGLTAALRRQEAVGLPRHDLRRLLSGLPLHDWESAALWSAEGSPPEGPGRAGIEAAVSGEILRRYALEDLFDEGLTELHLSGDLHLEDLGRPNVALCAAVPAELLLRGEPSVRAAYDLLDELVRVAVDTSRGVVLEDPAVALQSLVRGTRSGSPLGLSAWLRSLAAAARASGRSLSLGSPGPRFSAFTGRLVLDLAGMEPGPFAPRLFLDGAELDALVGPAVERSAREEHADAVELLLAQGRLLPTWSLGAERFAAPGCRRLPRERTALACGGAVALNLPRLARQAGPWREEAMLERLSGLVQCALAACRAMQDLQFRAAPYALGAAGAGSAAAAGRPGPAAGTWGVGPGGLRCGLRFALVPVGLREALRILGAGEIDPELGARLIGFLGEAAGRFAGESGPRLVLSPFFAARARARFAMLDAEAVREAERLQGVLFSGSDTAEGDGLSYGAGFRLSPAGGFWPGEAEARLLATVPAGALYPVPFHPTPAAPAGEADGPARPRLEAWRRFRARRERGPLPGRDVLFPHARPGPDRASEAARSPEPDLHEAPSAALPGGAETA